jgi:hypothetical protein
MVYLLIAANLIMIGAFAFFSRHLPNQIPLFYSQAWGEDQLGDLWMIFILPLTMNFFYIFNQTIRRRFFNNNDFVKKIFYYINLFIIFAFTFTFLKIIFLVN